MTVNVVNAMLKEQEVVYILKDCSTRAVLVDSKRLPIVEAVRPVIKSLGQVIVLGDSGQDDYISLDSVLDQGDDQFEPVETKRSGQLFQARHLPLTLNPFF